MTYENLLISRDGPVMHLRFNRPGSLNAFNTAMLQELEQALEECSNDAVTTCVVLSGEGRAFSAGADVSADSATEGEITAGEWRARVRWEMSVLRRIWDLPKPVVAAVHGYCLGYALDLALVSDFTIAREDAQFAEPEIRHCSTSTFLIMPYVLGMKQAKNMLLTGRRIDAGRAEAIGLVTEVAATGEFDAAVRRISREAAVIPPTAMRLNKASLNHAYELMGLHQAADYNAEVFAQAMSSPEARAFDEAVRAKGLKAALAARDEAFDD